ncbi:ABC transporter ATP-binding protein [Ulvibacter antarcticus]|uniref:Putative ABC transport system ATP-binding protein n=1 Tax=Ulvibacter antarcticus TaxID=442714 RepID=A0A3L9Z265_9FLAO|nr:ABC transporter ATP-binding protein [Ulvibacter antarcticus]RMA64385.1 putative ABC transport system ATP-binding protein [Ulvibacter antarcticus]
MITIKNLIKTYRTEEVETTALNQLSLSVNTGEFLSIMGPSGCGKSTLLNIIGLLDSPDDGSYQFDVEEVASYNEKQRASIRKANIGFVFQNFNLIDELSVYENVELPLIYNKVKPEDRKVKVTQMLERVGIAHRAKHFPLQLSGGQQQRVAVARALVTNPKLVLADEPTGNLDSKNGNEVMELLSELNAQGTTIIMVTHSAYDAKFSTRTISLKDGEIVSEIKNEQKLDILIQ